MYLINNKIIVVLCLIFMLSISVQDAYAAAYTADKTVQQQDAPRPYYFGALLGYGTTTWNYLTGKDAPPAAVPERVNEGGAAGGLFFGYEFNPYFAVEALYVYFPKAVLNFSKYTNYTDKSDNPILKISTRTQSFAFYGKFLAPIPRTHARAFALAGVEITHRKDILAKTSNRLGPIFGAGINYLFNKRIMGEFGFNYYTGFAVSEVDVVNDFIPFLYTVHIKLAYRF